ncbi:ATP-binding protein [Peloplasma aerotolerans]|uniref:histidine kinase n=1 Tax=Peloplasma aerotolerans TaxID=3044389 RepID=A0AAW6UC89_9MOLU|nr:ATP-binding protein [Mariniplasma sp. M4Ah]MDI6453264.1 ATP-binding protein [Mariniplasma sp. M4Ah]
MMLEKESNKYIFLAVVLILSTLLAFAFEQLELRRENILLIYIVSIMLIIVETRKVVFGIISTFLLVTIFNFFFTEPKYTFIIDDANYIVTLIIFMISIIILGTLTTSLQKEIYSSRDNAKKIDLLYQISKELLYANSLEEIVEIELKHLKMNLNRELLFCVSKKMITYGDQEIQIDHMKKEINYSIDNQIICGKDQNKFTELPYVIFPFVSKKDVSGVLIVNTTVDILKKREKEFIQTALLHMLTALEREKISEEQENIRIEMEKERIKSILLRSISHDLRTPLTTLQTGSSFLYDSYELIDDQMKKNLLLDINNETSRLAEFVENVLSMTRLQANQLILHPTYELIEDIFNDLHQRVNNRLNHHELIFQEQNQLDSVYADIPLLIQVLTNLIDNAIHHTNDDSKIIVSYAKSEKDITFIVEDNGGGIPEGHIDHVFEDFVASSDFKKGDKLRGIGLGLSICKAIVDAHGGQIRVENNDNHGATFTFNIPILGGNKS